MLQAPHCLLMGPAGSGKTTSIATFAKKGIECFVIVTEPTGVDSLYDAWEREKLDLDLLHYCVVPPASPGWGALKELGVKINNMSYKDLSELKSGIGKEQMKQYPKLLANMENFHDERTGRDYGDVTSWGSDRALVVDSLSGLSLITMQYTVGFKPSPHQGEWGIAMSATETLLLKLSSDCKCFFTLTSHSEKEPDEITGIAKIAVSTLGRKLAPKIPRFFSEVIRARKDAAGKFFWSTQDSEADLKNRALPSNNNLPQDFGPIVEAHRRREKLTSSAAAGSQVEPKAAVS
jgi:AAA domain